MSPRPLYITLLALSLLGYGASRHQLRAMSSARPVVRADAYNLPAPSMLRVLGLNHDAVTATLVWIQGLIYYGDLRLNAKDMEPQHLTRYAATVIALDPQFFDIYDWLVSTYLGSRREVDGEDLRTLNDFLDQGIERFPARFELPYLAGLNYIGYSSKRPPRQRIEELERGIAYLQRASRLEGCPDTVPFTIAWMYHRKRQLQRQLDGTKPSAEERATERAFFLELYQSTVDEALRARLKEKLTELGVPEQELRRSKGTDRLVEVYHRVYPYLSVDTWLLIDPTVDADDQR